jgi:hypothetical protein
MFTFANGLAYLVKRKKMRTECWRGFPKVQTTKEEGKGEE